MSLPRLTRGALAAVAVITLSFAAKALAADAKAQITEREGHCAVAGISGTVAEAMECFSASPEVIAYDVFTPREFDGPQPSAAISKAISPAATRTRRLNSFICM